MRVVRRRGQGRRGQGDFSAAVQQPATATATPTPTAQQRCTRTSNASPACPHLQHRLDRRPSSHRRRGTRHSNRSGDSRRGQSASRRTRAMQTVDCAVSPSLSSALVLNPSILLLFSAVFISLLFQIARGRRVDQPAGCEASAAAAQPHHHAPARSGAYGEGAWRGADTEKKYAMPRAELADSSHLGHDQPLTRCRSSAASLAAPCRLFHCCV